MNIDFDLKMLTCTCMNNVTITISSQDATESYTLVLYINYLKLTIWPLGGVYIKPISQLYRL